MATIEDQIRSVEEEIGRTQYNKHTQHHIGKLKAKLARLRDEVEKRQAKGKGGGVQYAVRKSGNATIGLVGFPSTGKSTLLNAITAASSEVGAYDFTTLEVIPGLLEYKGAKIQILDMPGIIRGASKGRGRGREVISVARVCDLVLLMVDVFETNVPVLADELYSAAIRLNARPPDVNVKKRTRGGLTINATVPLKKISKEMISDMVREFGHLSGDVVVRQDLTQDELVDVLAGNRVYIPAIVVLNKIDLVGGDYLREVEKRLEGWRVVPISAEKREGLERLKDEIYKGLRFIRIYLKPQGKDADLVEPLIVKSGSTVGMVCDSIHRDIRQKFRFANVWGRSATHPGQRVGLEHVLEDEDILTLVSRHG
ncbi:MAG: GTP-binding protein [Methanobacteriota archaeon]|nr:MAG: GTP-binding protein [Euryarchaeota archaeon]